MYSYISIIVSMKNSCVLILGCLYNLRTIVIKTSQNIRNANFDMFHTLKTNLRSIVFI